MQITMGHVIAYALDAQFGFEGEYPGPHRDIGKNIITINKILAEFRYNQPLDSDGKKQCNCVSGRSQSTGGCPIHGCTF